MENKVIAKVNGHEITENDKQQLLQSIGQNAGSFQGPDGHRQLLNELVMQELLYCEAVEKGFDKEEGFLKGLENMKKSLLKQYATGKLLSAATVTDEETKTFFEDHKQMFTQPETAKASHILVGTKEEADSLRKRIIDGEDFAEIAKICSLCPSKAEGGNLGTFTRGKMVPEFEQAAFSMKEGEISEPVKTAFGYHIIRLDSLYPAGVPAFEQVAGRVKEQCLLMKRQALYLEKQEELKKVYPVEIC